MNQRMRTLAITLVATVVLSVGGGCKTPTDESADVSTDQENLNPNKPNANQLITQQRLLGDSDKATSIWEIIDSNDGGFLFRGYYNNRYAIGKLDVTGQESWVTRSTYRVSDVIQLPALFGDLGNGMLTTGGYDSDFDERDDVGYVSLFNSAGELVHDLTFERDSASAWLRAIGISSASDTLAQLVGVGGVLVGGVDYPYLATFTVASDGTMAKTEDKVFMDRPNMYFNELAIDQNGISSTCYVRGGEYFEGTGYGNQLVFRMTEEIGIAWSQVAAGQEGMPSWSYNGKGFACSSNLLVSAYDTDMDKEVDPTSGGYWDAGVVARLSTDSSVDWVRTIALSEYTEEFFSCYVSGGSLYAAGVGSAFQKTTSKEELANALLVRFDLATGDQTATLTFGDEHYASQFNDVIVRGTQAYGVGYTQWELAGGPYRGWFAVIDVSGSQMPAVMAKGTADASMAVDATSWDAAEAIHRNGREPRE